MAGMDAAAQMGASFDQGGTDQGPSDSTPVDVVKGTIQTLTKLQGQVGDVRDGLAALEKQFPSRGRGGQQIAQLCDALQKAIATKMQEVMKQTAPQTSAQQDLGSVLR